MVHFPLSNTSKLPFYSVDFGGTGVKAAPVDINTGELQAERHRIPTPQPATPEAIAAVIKQLAEHFEVRLLTFTGLRFASLVRAMSEVAFLQAFCGAPFRTVCKGSD